MSTSPYLRLPRIGIDVDGVLARFDAPFAALLQELVPGLQIPTEDPTWPNHWDWDEFYLKRHGLTNAEVTHIQHQAWTAVKASTAFWATLPEYPTTREDLFYIRTCIENGWDIYFLTNRPGVTAKFQTEAWLMSKGIKIPFVPTVLITERSETNKPAVCKALGLDALIEDKPENLMGLGSDTKRYLLTRPWNRDYEVTDALRVTCVRDMLEMELRRLD